MYTSNLIDALSEKSKALNEVVKRLKSESNVSVNVGEDTVTGTKNGSKCTITWSRKGVPVKKQTYNNVPSSSTIQGDFKTALEASVLPTKATESKPVPTKATESKPVAKANKYLTYEECVEIADKFKKGLRDRIKNAIGNSFTYRYPEYKISTNSVRIGCEFECDLKSISVSGLGKTDPKDVKDAKIYLEQFENRFKSAIQSVIGKHPFDIENYKKQSSWVKDKVAMGRSSASEGVKILKFKASWTYVIRNADPKGY